MRENIIYGITSASTVPMFSRTYIAVFNWQAPFARLFAIAIVARRGSRVALRLRQCGHIGARKCNMIDDYRSNI